MGSLIFSVVSGAKAVVWHCLSCCVSVCFFISVWVHWSCHALPGPGVSGPDGQTHRHPGPPVGLGVKMC